VTRFIGDLRKKVRRKTDDGEMADHQLAAALAEAAGASALAGDPLDDAVPEDPYAGEPLLPHEIVLVTPVPPLDAEPLVSILVAPVYAPPTYVPLQMCTTTGASKALRAMLSDIEAPADKEAFIHWYPEYALGEYKTSKATLKIEDPGVFMKALLDPVVAKAHAQRLAWFQRKTAVMHKHLQAASQAAKEVIQKATTNGDFKKPAEESKDKPEKKIAFEKKPEKESIKTLFDKASKPNKKEKKH
jgi:hypothetical protein